MPLQRLTPYHMSCLAIGSPYWVQQKTLRLLLHLVDIAIPVPQIQQDKLTRAFLISDQAIPYQTRGGTCCPGVSTPKIWSLADSSTICHDGINHLPHFIHCSNHSIDPHHGHLTSREMEDQTLSQIHKPNSTSHKMEDLYDN
jgi:hypothetical protein